MQQQPRQVMDPPDEKNQAAKAEPTVDRLQEKLGVLLVDDDHFVRNIVQWGLELHGFQVWTATNGREAIDRYQEHRENIAVVLLDVHMPGLDGPQTLEALRELNAEVPACFMCGNMRASEAEELLQRGATSVITKPFLINDLANILRPLANGVPADLLPSAAVLCKNVDRRKT